MSGAAFWESLVKAGRAIYFPNIPLRLVAPRADAAEKGLNVVTFITVPQTTKTEVRNFLETVYKVGVERVHTINYEGKKKRHPSKNYYYQRADYKKVYVQLKEKWFPPKGFAVTAEDSNKERAHKHKPKRSPVKSVNHARHHWINKEAGADDQE